MMTLKELTEGLPVRGLSPEKETVPVTHLSSDSRKVKTGSLFVALPGTTTDGARFIEDAVERGAGIIVSSTLVAPEKRRAGILYLCTEDPGYFLRQIALRFFHNPSKDIRVIGVTGTNGKTTVTFLLEAILHEAEHSCSVIGTVNYRIGEHILPAQNTTPGFLDTQELLAAIRDDGVEYCLIEVSSHALDQGRVDHVDFKVAVFTNLTSDHLDYHQTRQNYFEAKAKLFRELSPEATAVINADDDYGPKLFSRTKANIITYGLHKNADVRAADIQLELSGTTFKLITREGEMMMRTPLVGEFNISNILAATAAALSEGIPLERIKNGIERMRQVPGRLERMDCQEDFSVFIDYAHTQDALEHVLRAIRQTSDGRIILVFGCGGDRDRTKRPEMGYVASQLANFSFITSDNSRSEDPQAIIEEIRAGFEGDHYRIIVDREEAIHEALNMAQKGDIVLIAGKGHEEYQIFKDRTIKFNERQIIRQYLRC